jgi:hypothetical protein
MIQTKECPKCGTEHRTHIKKCGCGYQWTGKRQEPEQYHDPMHGCCSYMAGTSRCHYPGTFSDSLKGDGTWYCSAHNHERDPVKADAIVFRSHDEIPRPDYSIGAIRRRSEAKFLKRFVEYKGNRPTKYNASKPGKDWAYRVLERQEQGEPMAGIAVEFAKSVIGDRQEAA